MQSSQLQSSDVFKKAHSLSYKVSKNIMSHQITIDYSKDRKKSKKKLNYV